jgi:predicted CoA-binding protein
VTRHPDNPGEGDRTIELNERVRRFLDGGPHAVVGASRDRAKYGNKVLRAYLQDGRKAYPVNPNAEEVEGSKCFPDLAALPERVHGVSVITPPEVTESVVAEAARLGIAHLWLQPGAESEAALALAGAAGMSVIAGGPCLLVTLRYRER